MSPSSGNEQRLIWSKGYELCGCPKARGTDGVPDAQGHKADWSVRKRNYLLHLSQAHDDVLLVSGADKLHNARAIVSDLNSIGEIVFERFSTKKDGTLWYYSSLFTVFKDRGVPMATAIEEAVTALLKNATG